MTEVDPRRVQTGEVHARPLPDAPSTERQMAPWFCQPVLILSTLALSWLGMQIVHETGHVIGACLTGGSVERVVLHPLAFSRTDLSRDPRPLIVSWSGALVGTLIPLAAWSAAHCLRVPGHPLLRFFAGFCLIANGAYLGVGCLHGEGDASDLLRHGAARWQLVLFGLIAAAAGLRLWHRLGPHFGLGPDATPVRPAAAGLTAGLLLVVVLAEWLLAS